MITKILNSNGVTRAEYDAMKRSRFFKRVLIIRFWLDKGAITLDDWFGRMIAECYKHYDKERRIESKN